MLDSALEHVTGYITLAWSKIYRPGAKNVDTDVYVNSFRNSVISSIQYRNNKVGYLERRLRLKVAFRQPLIDMRLQEIMI